MPTAPTLRRAPPPTSCAAAPGCSGSAAASLSGCATGPRRVPVGVAVWLRRRVGRRRRIAAAGRLAAVGHHRRSPRLHEVVDECARLAATAAAAAWLARREPSRLHLELRRHRRAVDDAAAPLELGDLPRELQVHRLEGGDAREQ